MKLLPLALLAAGLFGCSVAQPPVAGRVEIIPPPADLPRPATEAPPADPPAPAPAPAPEPPPAAAPEPAPPPPPPPPPPPAPPVAAPPLPPNDVIRFGRDAYKVEPRYRAALSAHAATLRASPQLRLLIRAHADPKGPADYNLALSKKRAETVAKLLSQLGAPPQQLVVSYHGEQSARESASADARRVELSYRRADTR
jgi:outer membrane protein OmpA-like peptidoglycan-associated protein